MARKISNTLLQSLVSFLNIILYEQSYFTDRGFDDLFPKTKLFPRILNNSHYILDIAVYGFREPTEMDDDEGARNHSLSFDSSVYGEPSNFFERVESRKGKLRTNKGR